MTDPAQSIALLLVFIAFAIGLVGAIIPLVPGLLVIWAAILAYAIFVDHWQAIHPLIFVLITLITIVFSTADLWLPFLGSKKGGANGKAQLFGLTGAVAGTFMLPVIGTIAGYIIGILAGEYAQRRAVRPSLKAGFGALLGWGLGTALELVGAIIVIAIFVIRVL